MKIKLLNMLSYSRRSTEDMLKELNEIKKQVQKKEKEVLQVASLKSISVVPQTLQNIEDLFYKNNGFRANAAKTYCDLHNFTRTDMLHEMRMQIPELPMIEKGKIGAYFVTSATLFSYEKDWELVRLGQTSANKNKFELTDDLLEIICMTATIVANMEEGK